MNIQACTAQLSDLNRNLSLCYELFRYVMKYLARVPLYSHRTAKPKPNVNISNLYIPFHPYLVHVDFVFNCGRYLRRNTYLLCAFIYISQYFLTTIYAQLLNLATHTKIIL